MDSYPDQVSLASLYSDVDHDCSESGGIDLDWGDAVAVLAAATDELTLFAAVGLAIGGFDDLCVDAIYLWRRLWGWDDAGVTLGDLPAARRRYALFIAAWDESDVIGPMLSTLVARLVEPGLTIFVGAYPNDPATIAAVQAVAARDDRIRLVVGDRAGPTTKADCLNTLWHAMVADPHGHDAVILHDAEDVVHAGELAVFDRWLDTADAVQLPVIPLPHGGASLVGGTYLDEFSEAHAKTMVVRSAIGAGLPLAGVGCAIARAMLDAVADARGGAPFDASSLTEDYELGLTIAAMGGRTRFALVPEAAGASPVAVRAYFPATFDTAARQKARWLLGIALAGWDRTGWGRRSSASEWWMRMRDRRAPLAAIVLLAAYAALALLAIRGVLELMGIDSPPLDERLNGLLLMNGMFLLWRLAMRAELVRQRYGVRQALLSPLKMLVGNIVAMAAARRAMVRYVGMLRGAAPQWDKTAHRFPQVQAHAG